MMIAPAPKNTGRGLPPSADVAAPAITTPSGSTARKSTRTALRIEHVGSTSVPGLPAKPVIDIQVSVASLHDEDSYVPPCQAAGLQLRSRDDGHRFFRPPAGRPRDVHVHVCAAGSSWERGHLLFRDFLRADRAGQDAYAAMKLQTASRWRDDRMGYTEAKNDLILDLLDQAERWAAARGWTV